MWLTGNRVLGAGLALGLLVIGRGGVLLAAEQPTQWTAYFTAAPGIASGCVNLITVPSNKRLVGEFVSAWASTPLGQRIDFRVHNYVGGNVMHTFLDTKEAGTVVNAAKWGVSQTVRLYADRGLPVRACYFRTSSEGTATGSLVLAGLLVDVP